MIELPRVETWVYTTLGGISGNAGVYSGVAPTTATAPYIVMQIQSPGSDQGVIDGGRVWTDPLLLVRAVGKTGSWSSLQSIADAIDSRLHGTQGTLADGITFTCRRESAFSQIDPGDPQYRHLGGLYRFSLGV